jgi:hypothetical protein
MQIKGSIERFGRQVPKNVVFDTTGICGKLTTTAKLMLIIY